MNQAHQQQAEPHQNSNSALPDEFTHNSLEKARVLLIDDDVVVLQTLSLMFSSMGFKVTTAMNADAIRQANLDHFQCIILDIWLPDSYGDETLQILANKGYKGAVLLISGKQKNEINSTAKLGLQHGLSVIGYCQKPVYKNDLTRILTRAPHLYSPSADIQSRQ